MLSSWLWAVTKLLVMCFTTLLYQIVVFIVIINLQNRSCLEITFYNNHIVFRINLNYHFCTKAFIDHFSNKIQQQLYTQWQKNAFTLMPIYYYFFRLCPKLCIIIFTAGTVIWYSEWYAWLVTLYLDVDFLTFTYLLTLPLPINLD